MSDTMKALDEVHDAKSELIMQTAPIRLAIMQSGEVSDRDRALCLAVEDLDAAIKRFVERVHSEAARAALTPLADDHPLSGVTHAMWSEMVRASNEPPADDEVVAIRQRRVEVEAK